MKHDIDTLTADICTSHPELAQDSTVVRAVVTEFLAHQPEVVVDAVFKANLRAELMSRIDRRSPSKTQLPWWLVYIVPVGVTAILLLVIQPQLAPSPQQSLVDDVVYPAADSSLKMHEESEQGMRSAATMSSDSVAETAESATDFFTAAFLPNAQSVRVAYLSLSQPGFIVVSGEAGVVVASELIHPGEYIDMTLPLQVPAVSGTTYTVTLFYDDADGVFVEGLDTSAVDRSGGVVSMQIIAP